HRFVAGTPGDETLPSRGHPGRTPDTTYGLDAAALDLNPDGRHGYASGMPDAALVLLAAGSGSRTGYTTNKVFLPLAGRCVLTWSLDRTASLAQIGPVVLVVRDDEVAAARAVLERESPQRAVRVVSGGPTRHRSEYNALHCLAGDITSGAIDVVVVHDAARPLSDRDLFVDVVRAARAHGGAVPGRRRGNLLEHDLRPTGIDAVTVQTPQAFRAAPLLAAHEAARRAGFESSDTAACVEGFGDAVTVRLLPGRASNIKITFAEDLFLAEALLARASR
ncbi:MAG: 2-C-methyl-D-erythritol 4-phosphate cytidylyltransferase, partial [Actinomycetota bacterium]|nr:2-C-methyl-D-erythritol 4-phosphate cytidylyltransferase [Actinomycetota bacterium]